MNKETSPTGGSKPVSLTMKLLLLAIYSLSILFSTTAMASPYDRHSTSLQISQASTISREEAVSIAKQGKNSKVLKVQKQQSSSGGSYKVKLLTKEGRVKQVVVNASTGQIERKQ